MLSQKNLTKELIKQYFTFLSLKDWGSACALVADQVLHDVNQGDRVIGNEPLLKYFVEMARYYEEIISDLVILVSDDGTKASAEYYAQGRYLKTHGLLPRGYGQPYEIPRGVFFDIEGGKISRITQYFNFQSFLEQIK